VPRWWALVLVGLLFLSGLLKANYEEFQQVETERNQLEAESKTLQARVNVLQDQLARPRTKADELRHSSPKLAAEILRLHEQSTAEKVWAEHEGRNAINSAETQEEKQQAMRQMSHWRDIMEFQYDNQFRSRAIRLIQEASEYGWTDERDIIAAREAGSSLAALRWVAETILTEKIGHRP
jgi:chromosome segregation ATPase